MSEENSLVSGSDVEILVRNQQKLEEDTYHGFLAIYRTGAFGDKPGSARNVESDVRLMFERLGLERPIDITPHMLCAYRTMLEEKYKCAEGTIASTFSRIKTFFKMYDKNNPAFISPFEKLDDKQRKLLEPKGQSRRPDALQIEEVEAILKYCEDKRIETEENLEAYRISSGHKGHIERVHDPLWYQFMYTFIIGNVRIGASIYDLCKLKYSDIKDLGVGINPKTRKKEHLFEIPYNRQKNQGLAEPTIEEKDINIFKDLWRAVKGTEPTPDDYLLCYRYPKNGGMMKVKSIQAYFRTLRALLGKDKVLDRGIEFTSHILRHTMATILINKRAPISTIMKQGGWATSNTIFSNYVKPESAVEYSHDFDKAIEKLEEEGVEVREKIGNPDFDVLGKRYPLIMSAVYTYLTNDGDTNECLKKLSIVL